MRKGDISLCVRLQLELDGQQLWGISGVNPILNRVQKILWSYLRPQISAVSPKEPISHEGKCVKVAGGSPSLLNSLHPATFSWLFIQDRARRYSGSVIY